jgi:hypothetical protein
MMSPASGLPLQGVELRVGFATQIVIALNRMSAAESHSRTAEVDAFASLTNARL